MTAVGDTGGRTYIQTCERLKSVFSELSPCRHNGMGVCVYVCLSLFPRAGNLLSQKPRTQTVFQTFGCRSNCSSKKYQKFGQEQLHKYATQTKHRPHINWRNAAEQTNPPVNRRPGRPFRAAASRDRRGPAPGPQGRGCCGEDNRRCGEADRNRDVGGSEQCGIEEELGGVVSSYFWFKIQINPKKVPFNGDGSL